MYTKVLIQQLILKYILKHLLISTIYFDFKQPFSLNFYNIKAFNYFKVFYVKNKATKSFYFIKRKAFKASLNIKGCKS